MKIPKRCTLVAGGLLLAFLVAAFLFVFNPFGLGPEPETVLSPDFFSKPVPDLSALELLVDGGEAFDRILSAIDTAEETIYVQTYIWKDDTIGHQVASKLKQAADRGVEVTVSKDVLGTVFELFDMLEGKPSPVYTKRGLKGHDNITVKTDIFADTDHSKYFIVDDRIAIFGGMNIADEYHTEWHDYMALAETARYVKAFRDKVVHGAPWPTTTPSAVVTVNDQNATEIRTAITEVLDHARERVIIEHAYFSDTKVIEAVMRAAGRGVQVDIILPKEPDTHIYPNWVTTNQLLESDFRGTLRIFLYPRMTHAKVMLVDGTIAAVGSANLTPRSMLTSREVTLFVHGDRDSRFIRELRDTLEADIAASNRITEPYPLGVFDRTIAAVSKYIW
jgi:cardiolipin synthase